MIAVVRVLEVRLADGVAEERGDGLLAVVEVHEAADLARHVRLVALVLEVAAELHHGVRLGDLLVGEGAGLGDLGVGHAELGFEHRLGLLPRGEDAKALEVGRGLDRLGLGGGGAANHGGAGLLLALLVRLWRLEPALTAGIAADAVADICSM